MKQCHHATVSGTVLGLSCVPRMYVFLVFIMQLQRKRHIGNDIVTIVFQDAGSEPFSAKAIRSQFQHVFIVVRAHNPNTANTEYRYVSFLPSIAISK